MASEFQERIAKLRKRWKKTKAASTGGISRIPEGKYQAELMKAQFDKDKYVVRWAFKVAGGKHAGKMLYDRDDLLRENEDPTKSGLAFFKANMETLGLEYDSPDPKAITKQLKKALGQLCDVFVKHNPPHFQNVYLNGLVDAELEEEDEEEEEEELEDEEESEEDEDEESEEDEDEEDEEDEEEEDEEELEMLFEKDQLVVFKHDGDKYEGKYQKPADEENSIVTVEEDGEEEEWEVENESLKRKPGRPKGAKNKKLPKGKKKPKEDKPKKKKGKKGKKAKDAEPDTDEELEEEWEDEWEGEEDED